MTDKEKTSTKRKLWEAVKTTFTATLFIIVLIAVLIAPFLFLTDFHEDWAILVFFVWLAFLVGVGAGFDRYKNIK